MIQLITFDLDDTLWPVKPTILRAEADMRAWLGERVPEFDERVDASATAAIRNTVLAEHPELRLDISLLRVRVLERALEDCGVGPRNARQLAQDAFEVFSAGRNRVAFYPGVLDTLDALKTQYRLAALTNGNADIRRVGLDRHMEVCVSPLEARARKPDPAIFQAMLTATGCQPHQVVHVGDHPEEDIGGAAAAGWRCVWVRQDSHPEHLDPPSNATITELGQLPAVLAQLEQAPG